MMLLLIAQSLWDFCQLSLTFGCRNPRLRVEEQRRNAAYMCHTSVCVCVCVENILDRVGGMWITSYRARMWRICCHETAAVVYWHRGESELVCVCVYVYRQGHMLLALPALSTGACRRLCSLKSSDSVLDHSQVVVSSSCVWLCWIILVTWWIFAALNNLAELFYFTHDFIEMVRKVDVTTGAKRPEWHWKSIKRPSLRASVKYLENVTDILRHKQLILQTTDFCINCSFESETSFCFVCFSH